MKKLRCAIYTRKSSEEGLDQAFNSLHAQRDACEAYVLSQAGEGWSALPTIYDDGGFSGGNMDRPALKQLLADIKAGQIDVVVVYKVDRLTRALGDFARIIEQFDGAGVSFVSVTQAFNTTSSMGRLTLNVLLSFAQFEREVTGERIRDKIAASKAKGMWMGGGLPLGYDAPTDLTTRALVINQLEAETVRLIFRRYLELSSVHTLTRWLEAEGYRTKITISSRGVRRGGVPFNRGALLHLLKNRTYIGEIPHKITSYPGVHNAIVDRETFDAVQALLVTRSTERRGSRAPGSGSSPLKGVLFDADGVVMSPTNTQNRHGRTYRYYVSTTVQQGRALARSGDAVRRISAAALERTIKDRLSRLAPSSLPWGLGEDRLLARVDALPDSLLLTLHTHALPRYAKDPEGAVVALTRRKAVDERVFADPEEPGKVRIAIAVRPQFCGGRTEYLSGDGRRSAPVTRPDPTLVKALRTAQALVKSWSAPSARPAPIDNYERHIARLALLAPDIQRAILDGRQPPKLTLQALRGMDLPLSWIEQRIYLGILD